MYEEIKPMIQANQTLTVKNMIKHTQISLKIDDLIKDLKQIKQMRDTIKVFDVHGTSVSDMTQNSQEEDLIAELNVRIRDACNELYQNSRKITYKALEYRLQLYYPGITRDELQKYNSDLLNQIIKEYDEAEESDIKEQ